ncbi:rhodanese-like domain-containing protein 7 [Papaver somniferum]|uniref:rhodanese-like domain-containing protein 7 n=1 Tax=Papaver somniferum TaxID=3469 RepID=UPI000E70108A|nr:rhodanese-like domain-containing protein 7 [Papaver somniferum]
MLTTLSSPLQQLLLLQFKFPTSSSPILLLRRRMLSSSSTTSPSPKFSSSMKINCETSSTQPHNSNHLPIFSTSNSNPNGISHHQQQQLTSLSKPFVTNGVSNRTVPVITSSEAPPVSPLVVVSFYKFADFPDHADLRKPLKNLCQELRVSGGIILAPEGINGSICGIRESVETVLGFIQSDDRLKGLRQIESPVSPEEEAIHHGHTSSSPLGAGEDAPFRWDHVRVKVKKEIVSLGMPSVSPIERVGKYVDPKEWNELISDPETIVIDVRNSYETRIGKFKGAVDPCTTAFRKFPSWVDDNLLPAGSNGGQQQTEADGSDESGIEQSNDQERKVPPPRVAMYCTGGIRCEKASSFLMSKGIEEVYHLKGGILKYLEEIPETESLWEGECFVFDKRVSVDHGLAQGTFKLCYGCKQPVSDADMEAPEWEYGVSCPYCFSSKSEEEKDRARARQRQFEAWGVIGGPDKGHRPVKADGDSTGDNHQHPQSF